MTSIRYLLSLVICLNSILYECSSLLIPYIHASNTTITRKLRRKRSRTKQSIQNLNNNSCTWQQGGPEYYILKNKHHQAVEFDGNHWFHVA